MRFELQGRGERASTLSAFEFDTLEDFGEALEALETDTPCLAFAPHQSPPPFTILAAFALAVKILAPRSGRARCTFPTQRAVDRAQRYLPLDQRPSAKVSVGAAAFEFVLQDVARVPADAIVNASNPSLTLGGGVSAAIRAACPAPDQRQLVVPSDDNYFSPSLAPL